MTCEVPMDQHMKAMDWMEAGGIRLIDHDVDDLICMVQQVLALEDAVK